ncbi:MAG: hypothetical protein QM658_08845 [Gordonia sp. (in: high G+C Gram-positive bacteria)]
MSTSTDRVVRISAEIYDDAAKAAERESRSTRQQVEYWMKLGRAVARRAESSQSRVEAAFAGILSIEDLSPSETSEYNERLADRVSARLADINFVEEARLQGYGSVTLGPDGEIIEHRPDGTTARLSEQTNR